MAAVVTMVLAGGIVLSGAVSASADSIQLCKGYSGCAALGMTNHGYSASSGKSYWRMYGGHNCTNYAAYMMVRAGMSNVRPWTDATGNASGWGVGYAKKTNSTPTVGSIAWWKKGTGHVAYVEAVLSPTEIIISEDSWGGDFYWRVIRKAGSGWPDGFVHFKDPGGLGGVPEYRAKPFSTVVYTDASKSKVATPTLMKPGTTAWVEMKFLNTGRTAWTGLTLATQSPNDHDSVLAENWISPSRAAVQREASVIPGNSATFGFAIRIPAGLADGTPVSESFAPVLADGTRVGYGTATLGMVADSRSLFSSQPVPSVAGAFAQGQTVTAAAGNWRPTGAAFTYAWKRDGAAISGANTPSYTITDTDVGRTLTVTVTAKAPRYITASKTSIATGPVTSMHPTALVPGDRLDKGERISSVNGRFFMYVNAQGQLVLRNKLTNQNLWVSKKAGADGYAMMFPSGNLATYTAKGKLVWSAKAQGKGVVRGAITSGGSFVLLTATGVSRWTVR